jgi:shikimate dehydrogenase
VLIVVAIGVIDLTGKTKIYGIIGDPIAHSLSPVMQNAAFAALNIDAIYVPFHVQGADLGVAIFGLKALNVQGLNVTIPHKETVCQYLDEIDASARLIGAVNTVVRRDGKFIGFNTDGLGLMHSIAADLHFELNNASRVIIVGAGGAARAAIVSLAQKGVERITIINRNLQRAQTLVERYAVGFPNTVFVAEQLYSDWDDELSSVREVECFKKCNLIINSTSIGLSGESFNVIPWPELNSAAVVYDMVYSAQTTSLVSAASAAGFIACGGLGMLTAQGAAAFELWTGQAVGTVMRQSVEDYLAR